MDVDYYSLAMALKFSRVTQSCVLNSVASHLNTDPDDSTPKRTLFTW